MPADDAIAGTSALAVLLALAALSPAPAGAWPRMPPLPPPQRWVSLPVRAREGTYRPVSFDGHVHTSRSHDADHPLRDVLALAENVGLDAIVITDHGSSHASGDLARIGYAGPLAVLVGEEVGGSYGHAVIWNVTNRRGVGPSAGSIDSLGRLVHERGGVVVLAHPGWWIAGNAYDPRRWMQYDALRRGGIGAQIDAIEIWNQVYFRPTRHLVDEWVGLLERGLYVPIVGGSDFHRFPSHDLGLPRNVALCPAETPSEPPNAVASCILEAVRAGRLYVTDGPSIALTVSGRTLGSTVAAVPGAPVVVRIRALAPEGGTLELHVGREMRERIALPPGAPVEHVTTVTVPSHDSFVRVEIARARPVAFRTPFSLLTNPVLLDVPPWAEGWRGPEQERVPAPRGFSRREVERAQRRARAHAERRRERRVLPGGTRVLGPG